MPRKDRLQKQRAILAHRAHIDLVRGMAGETIIDGSSYRPNFRYEFSLTQCQAKVTQLNDLMLQLQVKLTPPPLPAAKPAPARKSNAGCKKGRTRNAAGICGRWS